MGVGEKEGTSSASCDGTNINLSPPLILDRRRSDDPQLMKLKLREAAAPPNRQRMAWGDSPQARLNPTVENKETKRRHSILPVPSLTTPSINVHESTPTNNIEFFALEELPEIPVIPVTDRHSRRNRRKQRRFCRSLSAEAKTALLFTYEDLISKKMTQVDLNNEHEKASARVPSASRESPYQSDVEEDGMLVNIQKAMDILDSLKEKTGEHVTSTRHRRRPWNTVVQLASWRHAIKKHAGKR